ncbi:unnamed protein product [Rhizophagus irregularis]|nr:unnamed protein product [Rhizophagus irregularis]
MAGYAPKKFRGASGKDPELWLQEFRQWYESAGLDPAANARTRVSIHGIFETLLEDDARDWYETHIKGKNWECANLLDNIGVVTFAAVNNMNNGTIAGVAANQFHGRAGVLHEQVATVNTITGANFIPNHTVWDEDWSIANGRPTDLAINNPNANNEDAQRIGLENSVASILNKLEEIERYRTNIPPTPIVTYQGSTLADIENLINSKIPVTTARLSAVLVLFSSPFSSPQNDTSFQRLLALAYKLGLPRDVNISKVTLSDLEIFIDTELNKKLPPDHIYHASGSILC